MALQQLLDLQHVIGLDFGCGIDGAESAANDQRRQPNLQIGQTVFFRGAGELKRHQKIAGLADAMRQVVFDLDHRRLAGTRSQGNVLEAQRPGIVYGHGAAETNATVNTKIAIACQRQVNQFEKVLVPAHRDAVLGHTTEAGHDAFIQGFIQIAYVFDGQGNPASRSDPCCIKRLDFQTVDSHHTEPRLQQVVRQIEPCRPRADAENSCAVVRQRIGAASIERVPAGEEIIYFEAPRPVQDIGQDPRLDLRNIDRILLLVNAALHAVVADAVAGGRHQGIVDHDHRQRTQRIGVQLQRMRFRYALFQRATGEFHAQRIGAKPAILLVRKSLGAEVTFMVMAVNAVMHLVHRFAQIEARVSQPEAVAPPLPFW